MAGDYLLDTNIVVAYFASEREVIERLINATTIFIPVTVVGELFYGAFHSKNRQHNAERITHLLDWTNIVPSDSSTAENYGRVKEQLRSRGKLIPENDIWIAAAARQLGITLVSRDQHFAHVELLNWESW